MDFTSPYLTQQIIAYIGNKRKLLPLVYKAIESTGLEAKPGLKFFDVFSGSGSVSRLAKLLQFELYTNDWEDYAYILNKGFVEVNKEQAEKLFGGQEKLCSLLDKINKLKDPALSRQYIAKYYGPKSFDVTNVDFKTERLFYSRENALAIDKIRNYIERYFPESNDAATEQKRNILIAQLLYEAATHTNTSGVFKAYHKGFGGHGKDALTRILKQIQLHQPVLVDSKFPVHVYKEDANRLVKDKSLPKMDIAYLDPPYNQHQYGSNYHMLNTIARWDHIPEPLELNEKGELKEKAAIRHDWIKTKSSYCYKGEAEDVFRDLIQNLNARYILISYSTDGIIPFEKMRDICTQKGKLSIVTNEYTTYRGGKQSNKRQNTNIEFILCIDTENKSDEQSLKEIDALLARKKIMLLFKQKFSKQKLLSNARISINKDSSIIAVKTSEAKVQLTTDNFFDVNPPEDCEQMNISQLQELYAILSECICETKEDELQELLERVYNGEASDKMLKLIPLTLKKLASKKNKDKFYYWLEKIELLSTSYNSSYIKIENQIQDIKILGKERFTN